MFRYPLVQLKNKQVKHSIYTVLCGAGGLEGQTTSPTLSSKGAITLTMARSMVHFCRGRTNHEATNLPGAKGDSSGLAGAPPRPPTLCPSLHAKTTEGQPISRPGNRAARTSLIWKREERLKRTEADYGREWPRAPCVCGQLLGPNDSKPPLNPCASDLSNAMSKLSI